MTLVANRRRERSGSRLPEMKVIVFARRWWGAGAGVRFSASLLVTFLWRDRESRRLR
jgi:hypothetical protein